MKACVNLLEQFGDRYRVTFEEADDRGRKDSRGHDPWLMQIPCRRGMIYPYSSSMLAVEIDGHRNIIGTLRKLACCKVLQLGDHDATFLFDVADFPQVAEIVLPYRRPQLSDDQRQALRERMETLNSHSTRKLDTRGTKAGVKSPA